MSPDVFVHDSDSLCMQDCHEIVSDMAIQSVCAREVTLSSALCASVMQLLTSPETRTKQSACNCNPHNMQSLLQVDDELDAEELHLELHDSEHWAGASSSQRHGSSSSELASSEQEQDTQSNGWGPEPSSSAAASEQHDDGTRAPGFSAIPDRSMGMAAAQSDRQQQPHEEQEEDPSTVAQHMQQHQDGHPTRRGKRSGLVAKM